MSKRKSHLNHPPPDLKLAVDSLKMCRRPDGTFLVDQYLCACNQLLGFVGQLSRGLKITLRQMKRAIKTLEFRRVAGPRNYYETFQSLIDYEVSRGLARTKSPMSGCRALLLVHEHFKFITMFLQSLICGYENQNINEINIVEIYRKTIVNCHSLPMQALSRVCLKSVHMRDQLLAETAGDGGYHIDELLKEVIEAAEPICDRIHELCFDSTLEQMIAK